MDAAAGAGFELIGLVLATVDAYTAAGGTLASLARLLERAGLGVTDVVALSPRQDDDPAALGRRLAKPSTISRPRPRLPPVTSATLPVRSMFMAWSTPLGDTAPLLRARYRLGSPTSRDHHEEYPAAFMT